MLAWPLRTKHPMTVLLFVRLSGNFREAELHYDVAKTNPHAVAVRPCG